MFSNGKTGGGNWITWITCAVAGAVAVAQVEAAVLIIENSDDGFNDEVTEVYVTPVGAEMWGPNRISQWISVGDYVEIGLDSFGDLICDFDVLIVEADGDEYIYEMDLCIAPILNR